MSTDRIQASGLMWALDVMTPMHQSLGKGITVTRFVLGTAEAEQIEFEIVVTKIGKNRVPRTTAKPTKSSK